MVELTEAQEVELFNMWHISKAICSTRYDRVLYTARHLAKKFNLKIHIAYKHVTRRV
jgi:hypothetical protein